MTPTEIRARLRAAGYAPVPLRGKRPDMKHGWEWQKLNSADGAQIEMWGTVFPDATNTGVLTAFTPALDIDILHPEAAEAVEDLTRERFEERGYVLTRIGKAPKRAVLFRTDVPFPKINRPLIAPDGSEGQKLELLANGQQLVAHGIHPDTQRSYTWHGGEPGAVAAEDLPYLSETEAQQLVEDAAKLLVEQFGYQEKTRPKSAKGNGAEPVEAQQGGNWAHYLDNLIDHDVLCQHAEALVAAGMQQGAAVNYLRAQVERLQVEDAERKARRLKEIPDLVRSAGEKVDKPSNPQAVRPVDLWGAFRPPPLPRGLLPKAVEDFAVQQGELMGADPAGLAMAALTVCGAAIKDAIQLQVKTYDRGWMESARIWTALIGDPSTKKTPITRTAARPLVKIDDELWDKYTDALARYNALDKEKKKGAEPPPQVRLRLEDTTIEAAQEVLKDTPGGVLLLQDELSGWFGSMDKYSGHRGAAKDRGFWLQAWNGGSYAFNRVSRGAGMVGNLSVSVLGGIQPELIRKVAADTHDDGLLQRLFPIVLRAATVGIDAPISTATGAYNTLVEKLYALTPGSISFWGAGASFHNHLEFDAAAQAVRQELERKHLDLMKLEVLNKKLAAHIGKLDGLFARLCIIWHCVENCGGDIPRHITAATARRVADFLHQFLLPHTLAFYSGVLALADDHDRLAAVAGFILAHKLTRVTNRDIARGDRTMRGLTRHETEEVFEQLEALGWLSRTPGPRPSDAPHWLVNEHCHQLFAERAKMEAARRLELRAAIQEYVNARAVR